MVSGTLRTAVSEIVDFIERAMDLISDEHVDALINELIEAHKRSSKILIIGAGRTGLVGKAFAQRLLHLGYNVAVLGETIVPRINSNDLIISLSGSGRTKLVVTATEAAKAVGARIVVITSLPDSPLAKLADVLVVVPGRTKIASEEDYFARQILGIHEPLAPLGTLFEDTLMVFLDGVIVELMNKLGKTEEDLKEAHANIEI
ncbi:MAG: 6-phospho-3-hexuloisomerase [Desulfurococcaceae archaeon]